MDEIEAMGAAIHQRIMADRWRCLDVRACAARQVRREQEGEGT